MPALLPTAFISKKEAGLPLGFLTKEATMMRWSKRSRLLAIGDIHGCANALKDLLGQIKPNSTDLVVFLGDYIDRGPNSREVIDLLIKLSDSTQAHFIKGNHEEAMIASRDNTITEWQTEASMGYNQLPIYYHWQSWGGDATLKSYGLPVEAASLRNIPQNHWDFLESCVDYVEIEDYIFTHAPINPGKALIQQDDNELRWNHNVPEHAHISGKHIIFGHCTQKSGEILQLGHATGIDTYVYGDGKLTCIDVRTGRIWQAAE
jgi:serine/threonine protein phosphatase 1